MTLYQKFQAKLLKKWSRDEEAPEVVAFKKAEFAHLTGTVVEIGPGAGTNLKYYPKDIRWIGIEPNSAVNVTLRQEADRQGIKNYLIQNNSAEQLPLADSSCDTIIATYVLCSVKDQAQALREIKRVLKPGGKYIFLEHIAAPKGTLFRIFQNLTTFFHRLLAGNCHVNRETQDKLTSAGFQHIDSHVQGVKFVWLAWPHIWGSAIK